MLRIPYLITLAIIASILSFVSACTDSGADLDSGMRQDGGESTDADSVD